MDIDQTKISTSYLITFLNLILFNICSNYLHIKRFVQIDSIFQKLNVDYVRTNISEIKIFFFFFFFCGELQLSILKSYLP